MGGQHQERLDEGEDENGVADVYSADRATATVDRPREGHRAAGALLGINPFDQPAVQLGKEATLDRLHGDPHEAEDVTQETYIRAWQGLARLQPEGP